MASWPVMGKVWGLRPLLVIRQWMIGAPFSSLGMSTALMAGLAV